MDPAPSLSRMPAGLSWGRDASPPAQSLELGGQQTILRHLSAHAIKNKNKKPNK